MCIEEMAFLFNQNRRALLEKFFKSKKEYKILDMRLYSDLPNIPNIPKMNHP